MLCCNFTAEIQAHHDFFFSSCRWAVFFLMFSSSVIKHYHKGQCHLHCICFLFTLRHMFFSYSRCENMRVSGPWWMEKRELTPTRSAPERGLPLSPIQSTEMMWFASVSVSISIRASYLSTRSKITVLVINSISVSITCTKSHHADQFLTRDQSCWMTSVLYKIVVCKRFGFCFFAYGAIVTFLWETKMWIFLSEFEQNNNFCSEYNNPPLKTAP